MVINLWLAIIRAQTHKYTRKILANCLNIISKYRIPLNEINLGDFMYAKHLSVIEYMEEYVLHV